MKKSIAMKWVKALRSGKYKQIEAQLTDGNGFCCLGVLCEISDIPYETDGAFLPNKIALWAQVKTFDVRLPDKFRTYGTLAEQNDHGKSNFKRIADIIEANWKEL